MYHHEECIYKVKPVLKAHIYATAYKRLLHVSELTNPEMSASSSHRLHSACNNQPNLFCLPVVGRLSMVEWFVYGFCDVLCTYLSDKQS